MNHLLWPEGAPLAQGDGEEDCPSITPYLVEAEQEVGAIVVCPGGGYHIRAEHEGKPVAEWLNGLGISAFVLQYRVYPYRYPCAMLDAQRAIRYIRHKAAEFRVDPNRIGILGFSAGGHLASTVGTHYDRGNPEAADEIERESCRPDLMILCYPVITFNEYRHHGSMTALLGETPDEQLRMLLSNETQVTADTPPAFLWHTADDAGVPVKNSLLFADAMSRHQVPFELHIFPHGPHGLGLAEQDDQVGAWTSLCATWLRKQGW